MAQRHQRRHALARALLLLLVATHTGLLGQAPQTRRVSRLVMGTLFDVEVVAHDAALADAAAAAALDEVERVDRLLSHYKSRSELSQMNQQAGRAPFVASAELFAFMEDCAREYTRTRHAFDPSVGPLVRAWGFLTPHPGRPDEATLRAAQSRSGFDKVQLEPASRAIRFAMDGMEIDPGGIGKGYAVDRAVRILKARGITSALVSAGGSTLFGLGSAPGRTGWRIALRNPAATGAPYGYVVLQDQALSTSGVSQKSLVVDGRRVSHLFDPRSGEPVEGMCQVTVVAPDATASDALTKAAFVLPRHEVAEVMHGSPGTHALRAEGPCAADGPIWITPWSRQVFDMPGPPPS